MPASKNKLAGTFFIIAVRLISDIYRLFFLFGFTQGLRSFCADRNKGQKTKSADAGTAILRCDGLKCNKLRGCVDDLD